MRYLLDTNILVAASARRSPVVMARMAERYRDIALSAIVLHELYFGAFNSASALMERNLDHVETLGLPILPFDVQDARASGAIRARLGREGRPIGSNDILIAGQAVARGLVVVTANVREFARVEGLAVEDWTAA